MSKNNKNYETGTVIFREGDPADAAYLVLLGRIELLENVSGKDISQKIVEGGSILGELAVFDPQSARPYTARALEPSVLQTVSPEEFHSLLAECPPAIHPFLALAFSKMKSTKTKARPMAAALETDIGRLIVAPATAKMKEQFSAIEVLPDRLPFRIGGYPEGGEINRRDRLHLYIAAGSNPLQVSRQHCEIGIENKNLVMTDLGSRYCTTVNGTILGRGHGIYSTILQKGLNEVTLGAAEGPYKLTITCE